MLLLQYCENLALHFKVEYVLSIKKHKSVQKVANVSNFFYIYVVKISYNYKLQRLENHNQDYPYV